MKKILFILFMIFMATNAYAGSELNAGGQVYMDSNGVIGGKYFGYNDGTRALGIDPNGDLSVINNMSVSGQYNASQYTCTVTLSWNNGNVQYIQLANGGQEFTFANPKSGGRYVLILKQPSSGAAGTVTWPATVAWSDATAPTLTEINNQVDIISFVYDGTNAKYYGCHSLNY